MRGGLLVASGLALLGAGLYLRRRGGAAVPPWTGEKITRSSMASRWPPKQWEAMRILLLRPRPPSPGRWVAGVYEVPKADCYGFPRSWKKDKDAYYYGKTPWEFYRQVCWHLLVETGEEMVDVVVYPRNQGWILVVDCMWWSWSWIPPKWDLYAVSTGVDGEIT